MTIETDYPRHLHFTPWTEVKVEPDGFTLDEPIKFDTEGTDDGYVGEEDVKRTDIEVFNELIIELGIFVDNTIENDQAYDLMTNMLSDVQDIGLGALLIQKHTEK